MIRVMITAERIQKAIDKLCITGRAVVYLVNGNICLEVNDDYLLGIIIEELRRV
jgi:hypothetical protein